MKPPPGARAYTRATHPRTPFAGLTAIEVAIALVVLAILIAATLLFVRQRREEQHRQLQIVAHQRPGGVFDISLRSEPDHIVEGEPLAFILEIHNPTPFPLLFSWRSWWLTFELLPEATFAKGKPPFAYGQRAMNVFVLRPDGSQDLMYQFSDASSTRRIEPGDRLVFRFEPSFLHREIIAADTIPILYETKVHRLMGSPFRRELSGLPFAAGFFVNHPPPAAESADSIAP